jgi:serine/threonine protein kinase
MRGSIMALQAGTRLGAYEVLSLLGAGGSGEVYRARDTRLNREVAIKVLTAERVTDGPSTPLHPRGAGGLRPESPAHHHNLRDRVGRR